MFSPRLLVHSAAAGTLCAMLYWAAAPVHAPQEVSVTEISEYALYDRPSSIDYIIEERRVSTDYTVRPHRSHRVYPSAERKARCRIMRQNAMQQARDQVGNSVERARHSEP